jgi:GGDEF domain-containing protein
VFVAEKMRLMMTASPFATRGGAAVVTASFGVAATAPQGPDLTLSLETLIRTADECLYRSKQAGRNCTHGVEISASSDLGANG